MPLPESGKIRLVFVSGKVSKWQDVKDVDADSDMHWINCASDEGITCARFARLYVAFIEYATEEEVKALAEAEAKSKKDIKKMQEDFEKNGEERGLPYGHR